jgi:hypothetical protein
MSVRHSRTTEISSSKLRTSFRRRAAAFPFWGLMAVLVLAVSCGVFEPRESEKPKEGSVGSEYVQPVEPEVVISNLINVMVKEPHANYPELFAGNFTFVPDPDDALTLESIYGPGVFDDWDADVELAVGDRLFDRYFLTLLTFSEGTVTEDTDSSYMVLHQYSLDILQDEGWTRCRGAAKFRIKRDPSDNLWYISQWEDFRTEVSDSTGIDGTWGLVKGEIRATT